MIVLAATSTVFTAIIIRAGIMPAVSGRGPGGDDHDGEG